VVRSCAVAVLLTATGAVAAELGEKIEALLAGSAAAQRAFWGIRIVRLAGGETLFEKNPDQVFVPASNTKLFTTALALERLGPDHHFDTRVAAEEAPDSSGTVRGDLRLVGGGDPTLSARDVPYRKGPITGDPLRAIEELAGQVVALGVRRIEGDILGDDTRYVWSLLPEGWAQDDLLWDYGAPVSALSLNDNVLVLTVRPGRQEGEPARLFLNPPIEFYAIDNGVLTAPRTEGPIETVRLPGKRQVRLRGAIGLRDSGRTMRLAVEDPALFAAAALYDALVKRGVTISGRPVAEHRFGQLDSGRKMPAETRKDVILASRQSPPLAEILRVINKASQNLYAELVLREVGCVRKGEGTVEKGLEELREFLKESGLDDQDYELSDGSGLSRLNLVSPSAVVKLLVRMRQSAHAPVWLDSLPVGGEDGTLSERFRGTSDGRRIRAKTGTLGHVSAMSGYARTKSGDELAFAVLVNNYASNASEIRGIVDRIGMLMVQ